MSYTVIWTAKAEAELAAIWLSATDRKAVTKASATLDRILGEKPTVVGRSRFDSVRIYAEWPLGVEYDVHEDDRIVYVLAAWDVQEVTSANGESH